MLSNTFTVKFQFWFKTEITIGRIDKQIIACVFQTNGMIKFSTINYHIRCHITTSIT